MGRRNRFIKRKSKKYPAPPTRKQVQEATEDYLKKGGKITVLYIDPDDYKGYMNRTGNFCDDSAHDFLTML